MRTRDLRSDLTGSNTYLESSREELVMIVRNELNKSSKLTHCKKWTQTSKTKTGFQGNQKDVGAKKQINKCKDCIR